MSTKKHHKSRAARARVFPIEALERRALLAAATETFSGPSLTGLIALAERGHNTAPAAIDKMLTAFESQLESGPLADLNAGTVGGNDFVTEVQSLETSYEQNVDQQLSPRFPNVDAILKLQGQRVVADMTSLNQQETVGLITSSALASQAQTAIESLTSGPLLALGTPLSAYVTTTQNFETGLNTLASSLSSSASPSLTLAQVNTTLGAEAEAYRADMHSALQITHPNISNMVDTAVTTLENTAGAIATNNPSDAQSQLTTAITAFDTALLDTSGLFGPQGVIEKASNGRPIPPNVTESQVATTVASVSGRATAGGTATLTATLATSSGGTGVSGAIVSFTLDGAFAGLAVTNGSGVATLSGVSTSNAVGTDTGAVVATFLGDINHFPSDGTGDLTVSSASSTLGSVSGTATFGGTASLTATLTSPTTNTGISGATVNFTLDGTSVGSAVTNSNGVATLTGVATTDAAGTDSGVVGASFAGDATHSAAANVTGDLIVSKAATSLGTVSGAASFGGTATLMATLTSSVTNKGVSGETVSFTLDGKSVGTAVTDATGVATLTGVATTDAVGTDTDGVVASFAGDTNYLAATNATGALTVSKAATALATVSGTASFGGTATLTATLNSSVTNTGLAGKTVSFTLDGTSVGTAVTNSSGVATLSNVATTDAVGAHTGVVVASFAGDSSFSAATNATGDLTVSKAATTLTSVSGTAPSGGPATLIATLKSSVTNKGISGETVSFTLDTKAVGTAVTDSNGVATLTGVPTTDAVGTDTNGVAASFAGDTDYNSSQGTGNLVVS